MQRSTKPIGVRRNSR